MNIKMILFDLDGTLLPMDNDTFVNGYFNLLGKKVASYGLNPKLVMKAILKGTDIMVQNVGTDTNENVFWDSYVETYGSISKEDRAVFDNFYANEFNDARSYCGHNPEIPKTIQTLKDMGYRMVLATNPLFPKVAVDNRLEWAGLSKDYFELITSYETSKYCKPNLDYYREILNAIDVAPEECLMVGNNVSEDMIAKELGLNVFLITDCLINKNNEDINTYPHGDFKDLLEYLKLNNTVTELI